MVTPAKTIPGIIKEAVDLGVKERDHHLGWLQRDRTRRRRTGTPDSGTCPPRQYAHRWPKLPGCDESNHGLNATFATTIARRGTVGFISQSGALCTAILDWSLRENVGFSSFVSVGSMLDVDWSDLIYYLGDDPHTKSIVIYMETIGNARAFLSAAREVALTKPIIVIKPGRTEGAAKAAASHTGSLDRQR